MLIKNESNKPIVTETRYGFTGYGYDQTYIMVTDIMIGGVLYSDYESFPAHELPDFQEQLNCKIFESADNCVLSRAIGKQQNIGGRDINGHYSYIITDRKIWKHNK